ncbi:hypothetical protein GCM10010404_00400 [Nonomuraea africana]|uniref:Uncharacterized protein n=1 Tax=Nonomuraea africana TaxID=46171 RepID=A0ABR9KC46_9ACTN|nr:hypothetical protein [Nonomuraea africana]MBE1559580.1 hypothetical protein [Nonomuraea africana]
MAEIVQAALDDDAAHARLVEHVTPEARLFAFAEAWALWWSKPFCDTLGEFTPGLGGWGAAPHAPAQRGCAEAGAAGTIKQASVIASSRFMVILRGVRADGSR